MSTMITLGQFISDAGAQFMVYDLGRRVQPIDKETFNLIEIAEVPYPYPILQHANLALVFWTEPHQPFIWFVKFSLDEQGYLSLQDRNQFIEMVLSALGKNITQDIPNKQQQELAHHPFNFTPSNEKLAVFNALIRQALKLPPSSQYQTAINYFSDLSNDSLDSMHSWENIGLQGIADICIRPNEEQNALAIIRAFDLQIEQITVACCQCLEHIEIPASLAADIFDRFKKCTQIHLKTFFLRALASDANLSSQAIEILHQQNQLNTDFLVSIAARNWTGLQTPKILHLFVEALAKQEQQVFNQIFKDLVTIPLLRNQLLDLLRDPNRSDRLSHSIDGLFKALKS